MRVLTAGNMYPPHHLGGYELMWRSWVAQAREEGHSVRVLTTDYESPAPDPAIAEDADVHRELRWYWHDHEFPRMAPLARLRLERANLAVLERHVRELEPDAVCWWAMGGMSMSLIEAARLCGIPAAGVVVDEWLLYGPKVDAWQRLVRRTGRAGRLLSRLAGIPAPPRFDAATNWVFASQTLVRHARANGWTLPNLTVAAPGIDPARFPPRPARDWRGRLLYQGRIDERKGIEVAVRALPAQPAARLTVLGAGDERYERRLRGLVGELRLDERVTFETRSRSEVPAAYAEADVVLFPVQWEEPWGLVPLEAMASGVPVIATGTGGSGEYLVDGKNCLIYSPPDDPDALGAAVARLAADPDLRARLREHGIETARRFTERSFNDVVTRTLPGGG